MKKQYRKIATLATTLVAISASLILTPAVQAGSRWFDDAAVQKGAALFAQNCASCHGINAEGTADWKKTNSEGKYPPPPLDGTAHSWHHSIQVLKKNIQDGGMQVGGTMPAFGNTISDKDIDALIAFFQSKWPEELYQKWADRFLTAAAAPPAQKNPEVDTKYQITQLLRLRVGEGNYSEPVKTPVDGIYETQLGKNYAYLTEDGRFLFMGSLIDLEQGKNLTDIAKRGTVKFEMSKLRNEDKAIFPANGEEKAVLNVFTDTSCPYCKKLHAEVSHLQDAGISVHYIPYPRGSNRGPGYQTLKQVWCATDRAEAMTIAKDLASGDLPDGDCADSSLVDAGYVLGNKVGVSGTPAIFKSSGEVINGYVPYQQLIPRVLGQ